MNKLLDDLDKKIEEANSGMRVASPSVVISLNMAMNIRHALAKMNKEEANTYKAKRLDNGEWVEGYYGKGLVDLDGDKEIYQHFIMVWQLDDTSRGGYFMDYEVDIETVEILV